MKPAVSVIVPAYNAAVTIAETLESVLSQSFADIEVIVVDDGSTDKTKEIVARHQGRDCRLRYVRQPNAGVSQARNTGLEQAAAERVTCMDADDLWHREKLTKQLAAMGPSEDAVVLTGIRRFETVDGQKVFGSITLPPRSRGDRYDEATVLQLNSFQMVLINTALMPRRLAVKIGGWRRGMWTAEDWDFWIRAARQCKFRIIEEPLVFYRKHRRSATAQQDLLAVLNQQEQIIRDQLAAAHISKALARDAIIARRLEICSFFLYQRDLRRAAQVLARSLAFSRAWGRRAVWERAAEVLRLAFSTLLSGSHQGPG